MKKDKVATQNFGPGGITMRRDVAKTGAREGEVGIEKSRRGEVEKRRRSGGRPVRGQERSVCVWFGVFGCKNGGFSL